MTDIVPPIRRGVPQSGREPGLEPGSRGFESPRPDQSTETFVEMYKRLAFVHTFEDVNQAEQITKEEALRRLDEGYGG